MKICFNQRISLVGLVLVSPLMFGPATSTLASGNAPSEGKKFRGQLGSSSKKIKRENGKTYLWAGPRGFSPTSAEAQWYDFTGAQIPPEDLQFGIGKDSIPAIDDPLFVEPDDPRLLKLPRNPYRKDEESPKTFDDIPVIGYVDGDDVRAYPIRLLDRHELVNDIVGGKPVTVGW